MKSVKILVSYVVGLIILYAAAALASPDETCSTCHSKITSSWRLSRHARTQADVASEIAASWAGQTPDSVISGSQAEDCIACHGPTAISGPPGVTNETQAMGYFFTTVGGTYTSSTAVQNNNWWPNVTCYTCHQIPLNHPEDGVPNESAFNSTLKQYGPEVNTPSALCGNCHGSLRFASTDHLLYNGWKASRHGHRGQADVASELAASWAGQPFDSVILGSQAENCIACHAPSAMLIEGGSTYVRVLKRFFTGESGFITASTQATDTLHWPDVDCVVCHDPHMPDSVSFLSATSNTYQTMSSSDELCGQCHGNLRFPGTDHLSYNIAQGKGGVGVPDSVMMPGAKCVDCHMHKGDVDGTNAKSFAGHSWSVFVTEADNSVSVSCTSCHSSFDAAASRAIVDNWKSQYQDLLATAQAKVAFADSVLAGSSDSTRLAHLHEADQNLALASSDESGGAHNSDYLQVLLRDAIAKSDIATGVKEQQGQKPLTFALSQNYPNPFNPTTTIEYSVPRETHITIDVYNVLGQKVVTLVDMSRPAGSYRVDWSGVDDGGRQVSSGIYLYRIQAGTFLKTKKMVLLK